MIVAVAGENDNAIAGLNSKVTVRSIDTAWTPNSGSEMTMGIKENLKRHLH